MEFPSPEQRRIIVETARACINTPFVHQGRMPGAGIDCGGLVVLSGRAAGLTCPDVTCYSRHPWAGKLKAALEADYQRLPNFEALQPGAFILFWIMQLRSGERLPQHMGIWTGEGTIVHAWADFGKVCENTFDSYWQERVDSYWDFYGGVRTIRN